MDLSELPKGGERARRITVDGKPAWVAKSRRRLLSKLFGSEEEALAAAHSDDLEETPDQEGIMVSESRDGPLEAEASWFTVRFHTKHLTAYVPVNINNDEIAEFGYRSLDVCHEIVEQLNESIPSPGF
ncbi:MULTISPECIES: hypothetical protein [unclassified Phyllobacterium]|uniref:hypothetical protein n=1 Tax=unclassified Phyllobacterium TaxID=2638441 RepID=UPI003012F151